MSDLSPEEKRRIQEDILASLVPSEKRVRREVSHEEYLRRLEEEQKADAPLAERMMNEQRESAIAEMQSRLPDRFRGASALHVPEVADRLERLRTGEGLHKTSIVFLGVVGSGKTWLSYGYVLDAIRQGLIQPSEVSITTEFVLSAIAKSGYQKDQKMQELLSPKHKVFIIDDVGQADLKDISSRNEVWFELVDHIYRNNLTLVMTTNLTVKGDRLQKYLGKAVFSRLESVTGGDFVIPSDRDRRPEVFIQMESGDYLKDTRS